MKKGLKIFSLLLLGSFLLISLTGCGNNKNPNSENNSIENEEEEYKDPIEIKGYATKDILEDGRPRYTVHVNDLGEKDLGIQLYENDLYKVVFTGYNETREPYEIFYDNKTYQPKDNLQFLIINKQNNVNYTAVVSWKNNERSLYVDGLQYNWYLIGTKVAFDNQYVTKAGDVIKGYIFNDHQKKEIYDYYNPLWQTLEANIELTASGTWNNHKEDDEEIKEKFVLRILVGDSKGEEYQYVPASTDKLVYSDNNQKLWLIGHQIYHKSNEDTTNYYVMRFYHEGNNSVSINSVSIDGEHVYGSNQISFSGKEFGDLVIDDLVDFADHVYVINPNSEISLELKWKSEDGKTQSSNYTFKVNPNALVMPYSSSGYEIAHPIG